MSNLERYISLSESKGVYEDFWIDRAASIVFDAPLGINLEVQFWVPDVKEGEDQDVHDKKVGYVLDEESGLFDVSDSSLFSIIVPASVRGNQHLKIWIGSSWHTIIYDQGEEKFGRRVGLRIHDIKENSDGS